MGPGLLGPPFSATVPPPKVSVAAFTSRLVNPQMCLSAGMLSAQARAEDCYPLNLAFFEHTFKLFWPGTCPNRSEMAVGFTGTDFQAKWTILEPFRTILGVLGPT